MMFSMSSGQRLSAVISRNAHFYCRKYAAKLITLDKNDLLKKWGHNATKNLRACAAHITIISCGFFMTAELVSHQNAHANRICILNDSEPGKHVREIVFSRNCTESRRKATSKYARIMIQFNSLAPVALNKKRIKCKVKLQQDWCYSNLSFYELFSIYE